MKLSLREKLIAHIVGTIVAPGGDEGLLWGHTGSHLPAVPPTAILSNLFVAAENKHPAAAQYKSLDPFPVSSYSTSRRAAKKHFPPATRLPRLSLMTPRTTRRQMLSTELSESLRRNLLWEREISRGKTSRDPAHEGSSNSEETEETSSEIDGKQERREQGTSEQQS